MLITWRTTRHLRKSRISRVCSRPTSSHSLKKLPISPNCQLSEPILLTQILWTNSKSLIMRINFSRNKYQNWQVSWLKLWRARMLSRVRYLAKSSRKVVKWWIWRTEVSSWRKNLHRQLVSVRISGRSCSMSRMNSKRKSTSSHKVRTGI